MTEHPAQGDEGQVRAYFNQHADMLYRAAVIANMFALPSHSVNDVHFGERYSGPKGEFIDICWEEYGDGESDGESERVPLSWLWLSANALGDAFTAHKAEEAAVAERERVARLEKQQALVEAQERATYERLKLKFDPQYRAGDTL